MDIAIAEATASDAGLLLPNVVDSTILESDDNDGDEELRTSSMGSAKVANNDLRRTLVRLSMLLLCLGKKPHYHEDPRFLFKPQKDSTTTRIFPGLAVLR